MLAIVAAACVGARNCSLVASTNALSADDPCFGTAKSLTVAVACGDGGVVAAALGARGGGERSPSSASSAASVMLALDATVPFGTPARVRVPLADGLGASASSVVVGEGEAIVWRDGAFIEGAAVGITSARAASDARAIESEVGSGMFAFVAAAAAI